MIEYEFPRIAGPTKIFYAKISIDNGGESLINPKLIAFGNLTIGSDESENEMILYPGSFVMSFHLDTLAQYYLAMGYLKYDAAEIVIREDDSAGDIVFQGTSKWETIEGNPIDRLITITFYDEYKQLNESFVRPDDGASDFYTIDDIISDTLGINFSSIEIVTDMEFQYIDGENVYTFQIPEFAFHRKNKFFDFKVVMYHIDTNGDGNTDTPLYHVTYSYDTKGKVLLSLLNQFASFGVIGLNKVFYVVPRFYQGGSVINITKADTYDGVFRTAFTKQFLGMRLYEKTIDVFYADFDYGNVAPIPDTWEEFTFPDQLDRVFIPAGLNTYDESGTVPGTAAGIRRKDSLGNLFYIATEYAKYKQADGNYSTASALLNWVGNLIWSNTVGSRRKYFIEMKGTDFNFTQFFTIEGETSKYRPVKISYNFMKDSTELTLVECPTINEYPPE